MNYFLYVRCQPLDQDVRFHALLLTLDPSLKDIAILPEFIFANLFCKSMMLPIISDLYYVMRMDIMDFCF